MQVKLTGGFYKAKSLLAGAQRCLNLFPEANETGSPYPYTYYLTPGLTELAQGPVKEVRGLYTASTGDLYCVIADKAYYVSPAWVLTELGTLTTSRGQVSFSDNRFAIVLVDGSDNGYVIDPVTRAFQQIQGEAFYGANRVRYVDTFFAFNRPGTNQWYTSLAGVTPAMLTGGPVIDGTVAGGTGYASGTHLGVQLTGGTGSDVSAEVVVTAGVVTAVNITVGGDNYRVGDVLSASAAQLGGGVSAGSITTAGSGYVDAAYTGVALTGGSGEGAEASITVSGGVVTVVTITTAGSGYVVGEVLSAPASALGGVGSGFTYTLTAVTATGSGFTYTLTEVGSSAFNSLDIAAKTGSADGIATLEIVHKDIWLFGDQNTSEVWYNVGGADFAFTRMPGVFIEHGCVARDSVAKVDLTVFWLGEDKEGHLLAFVGMNYAAQIISTPAVQAEWESYERVDDAIGFCYQQGGHAFWMLTFPTANRTWVFDLAEKLWHERAWCDDNSNEHRVRANCMAFAYGKVVVGDFENGKLYALDTGVYTDAGQPILRKRGFPHLIADANRVAYKRLILNLDPGLAPGLLTTQAPEVSLRMSDTRGASFGNPVIKPVGATGQYATVITWWQLGMGRDRVFEVFWDFPYKTALTGAWIDADKMGT